jgi:excisionase family DNA binding protein
MLTKTAVAVSSVENREPDPFAGRRALYIFEVAKELGATERQVRALIDTGDLEAINIGNDSRKYWRIPVAALKRFMASRSSLNEEPE